MSDVAEPLPRAEVEHVLPGRMRLRLRARRGEAAVFERLAAGLQAIPGVQAVRANAGTGSILISHGLQPNALLVAARDRGLFDAAGTQSVGPGAAATPRPLAAGPIGPLDAAALGLAGAGVLQLARGSVIGSASENLWNAYGLYAVTRQTWLPTILAGFGALQVARGRLLGSATSLFLYALSARRMARRQTTEDTI